MANNDKRRVYEKPMLHVLSTRDTQTGTMTTCFEGPCACCCCTTGTWNPPS